MNTKTFFALSIFIMMFSSCGKNKVVLADQTDSDIEDALKNGTLINHWIINDEDGILTDKTKGSETFKNKPNPQLNLNKDKSYSLSYSSTSGLPIIEGGTWSVNNRELLLKGESIPLSGFPKDYNFYINKLDEETLYLSTEVKKTIVETTNKENSSVNQTVTINETLYLEDND